MERELIHKLIHWKATSDRKPLLLQGARQVGKIHLLKDFGKRHFAQYHYLNFEEDTVSLPLIFADGLDPEKIVANIELYLDKNIDREFDLINF